MNRSWRCLVIVCACCAVPLHAQEVIDIPGVVEEGKAAATGSADAPAARDEAPAGTPGTADRAKGTGGERAGEGTGEVQEIIPMPEADALQRSAVPQSGAAASRAGRARATRALTAPVAGSSRSKQVSLDDPIASFGGETITRAQLYHAMAEVHGRDVFARLVNRALLRAELERRNIAIGSEEIEAAFREHLEQFTQGAKDEVSPTDLLRSHFGLTPAEYKEQIVWVELALKRLVSRELHVTDADLFNYYWAHRKEYTQPEEVRAGHILISPYTYVKADKRGARAAGAAAWRKAFQAALQVQEKLRAGAEFQALARRFSQDKSTAARGGDVGFFPRKVMLKPFEDAAFGLKKGEISELVKTPLGYHLIRVTDRTAERLRPFNQVKEQVRADYEEYLTRSHSSQLLQRLRRRALETGRLKILDPALQPDVRGR